MTAPDRTSWRLGLPWPSNDLVIDDRQPLVKRVVVLTPSLSSNASGRAMLLADLAASDHVVSLVGPSRGPWWPPLRARPDIEVIDLGDHSVSVARRIRRRLRDATTIAVKPLFSTFGSAWLASADDIVLDIDDPEFALMAMDGRTLARSITRLDGPVLTAVLLGIRSMARAVTVANSTLQSDYGGTVIPHARDERQFPAETTGDRAAARRALGLPEDAPLIVFVGTVRAHKGVDILLRCVDRVAPARIAIVGATPALRLGPNVIAIPPTDYATAIRWVVAADVVAVPQRDGPIGRRQSPAKVVDALAAGRTIVASDLGPIREMVGDAAVLVEPGSSSALATALTGVLADADRRRDLEARARSRFLEGFSFETIRPRFLRVLAAAEAS